MSNTRNNNIITRRSALKLLGLTTAALAAGGTSAMLESCTAHGPGKKKTTASCSTSPAPATASMWPSHWLATTS